MFKVEFYIDDKKLGESLRAIAGLAYGQPSVVPVENVEKVRGGKLKAKTNGGTAGEQLIDHMRKSNIAEVTAHTATELLKQIGVRRKQGTSQILRRMVDQGLFTIVGKRGTGNRATYKLTQ